MFPRLLEPRGASGELVLVINKEHTLSLKRSAVFSDSVLMKTNGSKRSIRNFVSLKAYTL